MRDAPRRGARPAESEPAAEASANDPCVALTVLATVAVVAALRLADAILVPVVLGILIGYALAPLVSLLARVGVPRGAGAVLVVFAFCAIVVGGAYTLSGDVSGFVAQLPEAAHRVTRMVTRDAAQSPVGRMRQAAEAIETAANAATRTVPRDGATRVQVEEPPIRVRDYLLAGTASIAGIAAQIVVVLLLVLYLLASGDLFKRKLVSLVGPSMGNRRLTVEILDEIDRQVSMFLLVRAAISALVGVATWLALALVGFSHAALWGVAAGVLNVIPYLGPITIAIGVAITGFLQFDTALMALVASGLTVAIATLEGYWLTPWLTGRAARMNGVAVFVGLLFWGWTWGVWGLLLAVPVLMVIKAVCDRIEPLQPVASLLGE